MRLTNQSAAGVPLPVERPQTILFDDDLPGFGLCVNRGGSRQWIVQYRNALGKTRRETLGRVGLLSATDARREASVRLARAKLGDDPHAERAQARARAAVTVGSKVEPYLEAMALRLRPGGFRQAKWYMVTLWAPLHRTPLHAVTRAQITEQMAVIARESGLHSANRARSTLSAFFAWLVGTGAAETNPVIGTLKAVQETRRARVLTKTELQAVLAASDPADDFGRIVRLLALTAQRRAEVAGMRWSELDLAGGIWRLPAERTKNGQPHEVPLSRPALDVIAGIARMERRDFVFGQGAGAFSGFSAAKRKLDERSGVSAWRLHDLRRTAATRMGDLGVFPHVVEAVLNHISGSKAGVAGIYNWALYNPEKRAALDLWGGHVADMHPPVP